MQGCKLVQLFHENKNNNKNINNNCITKSLLKYKRIKKYWICDKITQKQLQKTCWAVRILAISPSKMYVLRKIIKLKSLDE